MYRILDGNTRGLLDAAEFIEVLNTLERNPVAEVRQLFDRDRDLVVTRAPGRLDVMGGIADYSGSLVLELPIREATFAAIQHDSSRRIRIVSLSEGPSPAVCFEMPLADLEDAGRPIDYESARRYFARNPADHWAAYVSGVFLVLMRERGISFVEGARILVSSRVPQGKGVSSSAALEVAAMQAVSRAFDISLNARDMALLCQMVENLIVGAPCGAMDQMTASCGEDSRLLALFCQPAELRGSISVPEEIRFWGLDSGVRHAVTGADYGSVRCAAFMGYRIIAELAGLEVKARPAEDGVAIEDPRWNGYLANITPAEFENSFAGALPETMSGESFLARYSGTPDAITRVVAGQTYAVRAATAHPVHEHHRVRRFAELLGSSGDDRRLTLLGELMFQSHASYSACGLGSSRTDRLVELAREAGPRLGLYGAKITGGGSGGTVAVLGRADAGASIASVAEKFAGETNHHPYVFEGSSPGSAAFGHLRLGAD